VAGVERDDSGRHVIERVVGELRVIHPKRPLVSEEHFERAVPARHDLPAIPLELIRLRSRRAKRLTLLDERCDFSLDGLDAGLQQNQLFANTTDFATLGASSSGIILLADAGGLTPKNDEIHLRNNYTGPVAERV